MAAQILPWKAVFVSRAGAGAPAAGRKNLGRLAELTGRETLPGFAKNSLDGHDRRQFSQFANPIMELWTASLISRAISKLEESNEHETFFFGDGLGNVGLVAGLFVGKRSGARPHSIAGAHCERADRSNPCPH